MWININQNMLSLYTAGKSRGTIFNFFFVNSNFTEIFVANSIDIMPRGYVWTKWPKRALTFRP